MKRFILHILLILTVCWLLGLTLFNYAINHYEIDAAAETDAIIVLTGGRNRISEAVKLLNEGLAEKLFISGVQKDISLDELSKRDDISINTEREIVIENKSNNTVENAIETNNWINKNKIKSIRLVTSNYHIPRSLKEFKSRNNGLQIIIHPVYSENVSKNILSSWGSFYLIASEYNKFLYVYAASLIKDLQ